MESSATFLPFSTFSRHTPLHEAPAQRAGAEALSGTPLAAAETFVTGVARREVQDVVPAHWMAGFADVKMKETVDSG